MESKFKMGKSDKVFTALCIINTYLLSLIVAYHDHQYTFTHES